LYAGMTMLNCGCAMTFDETLLQKPLTRVRCLGKGVAVHHTAIFDV
jgi:hypothetical protein